jgi:hypothetical protein
VHSSRSQLLRSTAVSYICRVKHACAVHLHACLLGNPSDRWDCTIEGRLGSPAPPAMSRRSIWRPLSKGTCSQLLQHCETVRRHSATTLLAQYAEQLLSWCEQACSFARVLATSALGGTHKQGTAAWATGWVATGLKKVRLRRIR